MMGKPGEERGEEKIATELSRQEWEISADLCLISFMCFQ